MDSAPAPAPLPFPTRRLRRPGKTWLDHVARISLILVLLGAVGGSGWLGVRSAKLRQGSPELPAAPAESVIPVTLVGEGDPVYLAESAATLRRFFTAFPTASERATADVESYEIRKLRGNLEMRTLRAEGDVVQVEITAETQTAAVGGTSYWIHYSQMPAATSFDPIISPIPN